MNSAQPLTETVGKETTGAQAAPKRLPGRPPEFDRAVALQAAMLVFWRYGYEGSSLTQLTEAMGISRPTLYASFGDKVSLFREAVIAYTSLRAQAYTEAMNLPTARGVAEAWLRLTGGVTRSPGAPSGCFIVQGALVGSADSDCLRGELADIRQGATVQLTERFQRAQLEGDLPSDVDAGTLAEYLASLASGMAVQSASGSSPEQLHRVVDLAMANWPVDKVEGS